MWYNIHGFQFLVSLVSQALEKKIELDIEPVNKPNAVIFTNLNFKAVHEVREHNKLKQI